MSAEEVTAATRRGEDSPLGQLASERELPLWCGLASVAGVFAALALWSWGKWTDVHIDFGAELYIPWRISEGDVLYRDIAYRHGPLSHNLNALFFRAFGVSLRTLVCCNLAILAGICALIFRVFRRAFGRGTATGVCCAFLAVFGFSQYVGISNYNYVTPYLHAQTHGLALALAMMVALLEALASRRRRWSALAGLCFGGLLLTKAELAVPAAGCAAFGLFLIAASDEAGWAKGARFLPAFAAAALLPVAACYGWLRLQMPAELARAGVLGNWGALGPDVFDDFYYRRGAGLDDVPRNLRRALGAFGGLALATAAALAGDWAFRARRRRGVITLLAGCAVLTLLLVRPAWVSWEELPRALPLTSAIAAVIAVIQCSRARKQRALLLRIAPLALWSLFACGILGKMILNTRLSHYGFVLAMPATLLLIASLVAWIPDALQRRFGRGELFRALAAGAVVAGVVFHLRDANRHYEIKDFRIGEGADAMLVENPRIQSRGRIIAQTLGHLRAIMPPAATLLVLPDGVGINYRLRRVNPTRFTLFLPAEFGDLGGQAAVVANLRAHSPDFIVLVHRNHEEFGVGPFGADPRNGRAIMRWVGRHYRRVERFGEEPFQGRGFGTVILRRREERVQELPGSLPAEALR
jgi:hypothetical protein